ncbi:probable receptor-like protein kinase At5g59700 [Vicia villosa]|uniref:probable receptor-like protein kinase At5g59700 n=1 Tax=Vicia villosa TaxID=3911 RepID=UPI00273BF36F|nr:probable receptor-like protein kinase At5g59700 [Vicia villosa]
MAPQKLFPPSPAPPPPPPPPISPPSPAASTSIALISGVFASGVVILAVLVVIWILHYKRRKLAKKQKEFPENTPNTANDLVPTTSTIISGGEYQYILTLSEVEESTNYFDEALVIGVGGFGKVYMGELRDGRKVAVKRGSRTSSQGVEEFKAEIETLFKFRHGNLVSLIGYCDQNHELILVYEFVENGTLKSHLYGSALRSLSWNERLNICIGAARGLHYLHTAYPTPVIHRDVKSVNILLDGNLNAKVGDFGISRTGPNVHETHVSTGVKGTFGYLNPEYFMRQQLTEKSDVYSFGIVLFEILCARPVIDPSLPSNAINLKDWAINYIQKGQLDQIIDPNLIIGDINPDSLKRFMETAESCVADRGVNRPSMRDVLWNLECSLQFQGAALHGSAAEDNSDMIVELATQDATTDFSLTRVFSRLVISDEGPERGRGLGRGCDAAAHGSTAEDNSDMIVELAPQNATVSSSSASANIEDSLILSDEGRERARGLGSGRDDAVHGSAVEDNSDMIVELAPPNATVSASSASANIEGSPILSDDGQERGRGSGHGRDAGDGTID